MTAEPVSTDPVSPGPVSSSYLDLLPVPLREGEFLGRFLLAFEAVLDGHPDVAQPGLTEAIAGLEKYFDPLTTPGEFLPWLGGWLALSLRADWDEDTKRGFLREVVPLYRKRGTLAGLRRILEIYLRPLGDDVIRGDVVIFDTFAEPAHFFQVQLTLGGADRHRLREIQQVAEQIIDQEKPAHTFFALKVRIETMRLVSERLRHEENDVPPLLILGENTWLGTAPVR
jgi:phage tail-like protein